MREMIGDIFKQHKWADACCITTNGYVNKKGLAVLGRGVAYQAASRVKELPELLAEQLKRHGNVVNVLMEHPAQHLISFPVKPVNVILTPSRPEMLIKSMRGKFKNGDIVPGCFAMARLSLVERSARQLAELADKQGYNNIVLPRPGCGNGELAWEDVKPLLQSYLDDRFYICTYAN